MRRFMPRYPVNIQPVFFASPIIYLKKAQLCPKSVRNLLLRKTVNSFVRKQRFNFELLEVLYKHGFSCEDHKNRLLCVKYWNIYIN